MKLFLRAIVAAILVVVPMCAVASDIRMVHTGQIPSATQDNGQIRADRVGLGTLARDLLGPLAIGSFGNIAIVPNGGMYVSSEPLSVTAGPAALYQLGPDDPLPLPQNEITGLAADTTPIVRIGLQTAPVGGIGPMTAPSSGSSVIDLVEAQISTADGPLVSVKFQQSGGGYTTQPLPILRTDQILYQVKSGNASSTPLPPTPDTGWIPIASVTIPAGTTAITQSMITALPSLTGFVATGGAPSFSALNLSGFPAGCLQSDANGNVSSLPCTSGLGSVASTFPITATTSGGTATVACPTCVTGIGVGTGISSTSGTSPTISLSHGDYMDLTSKQLATSTKQFSGIELVPGGVASSPTPTYPSNALLFDVSNYSSSSKTASTQSISLQAQNIAGTNTLVASNTATGTNAAIVASSYTVGTTILSSAALANPSGPLNITANNGPYSAVSINGAAGYSPVQFTSGPNFLSYIDASGNYVIGSAKYGQIAAIGNNEQGANANSALDVNGDVTVQRGSTNAGAIFFGTSSSYEYYNGTSFNFSGGGVSVAPASGFQLGTGTAITQQSTSVASISCGYFDFQIIASTSLGCMDGSGNFGVAGGFYQASERRLKRDIADVTPSEALAIIMRLNPVSFKYKTDKQGRVHRGFIADVSPEEVAPEHKSIDIGSMEAYAIKVIQQQQLEILDLQNHKPRATVVVERGGDLATWLAVLSIVLVLIFAIVHVTIICRQRNDIENLKRALDQRPA